MWAKNGFIGFDNTRALLYFSLFVHFLTYSINDVGEFIKLDKSMWKNRRIDVYERLFKQLYEAVVFYFRAYL